MPKEIHRKKHRSDAATKENQNKDDRASNQLFSKADANSVELSGYTAGYGSPQRNGLMPEHSIPTGVGKYPS